MAFVATQARAPSEPILGRSNSLKLYVEKELNWCAGRTQAGVQNEPNLVRRTNPSPKELVAPDGWLGPICHARGHSLGLPEKFS